MPYHRMKLLVGIFVTLLVVSIITTFSIVLEKKGFFQDKVSFYFMSSDAGNFYVGMPLNVSGFEVGTITERILTDNGDVKVIFKVSKANHKWICEDTLLMLNKPLIGSPTIKILTSLAYDELKENSKLEIIIRDDINDIVYNIQPIMDELQDIIHSIHTITYSLSSKDGAFEKSLSNIEKLTSKLVTDDSLLTSITGDANATKQLTHTIYQTTEILENLTEMTKALNNILENVQKELVVPAGDSLKNLNAIFKDIEKKLSKLDGTVNALGTYDKELLTLKKELHINLDKTQSLLEKVDMMLNSDNSPTSELP